MPDDRVYPASQEPSRWGPFQCQTCGVLLMYEDDSTEMCSDCIAKFNKEGIGEA